ncbi:MAG: hypothetical protein VKJ06_01645 [Vampirovibrionales bacterium]|nr:hypothetical protein [Vampirovibrionales bacterium]
MQTILIHGIGDNQANFAERWQTAALLNLPERSVVSFYYEDLMDETSANVLMQLLVKAAEVFFRVPLQTAGILIPEYVGDVVAFLFDARLREAIATRLRIQLEPLAKDDQLLVIGHSQGALVAVWLLLTQPWLLQGRTITLATLGCPLGSPVQGMATLLKKLFPVKKPLGRPNIARWINVHSKLDPLSGEIRGLGCDTQVQAMMHQGVFHRSIQGYLKLLAGALQAE